MPVPHGRQRLARRCTGPAAAAGRRRRPSLVKGGGDGSWRRSVLDEPEKLGEVRGLAWKTEEARNEAAAVRAPHEGARSKTPRRLSRHNQLPEQDSECKSTSEHIGGKAMLPFLQASARPALMRRKAAGAAARQFEPAAPPNPSYSCP